LLSCIKNRFSHISRKKERTKFFLITNEFYSEFDRLWIKRREEIRSKDVDNDIPKLKYLDFEPFRKDGNFENLDDVVSRINAKIRAQNFDGRRLITIESLNVEANGDWKIDTELSVAEESSRHVTIIRLFYEEGPCLEEEIGIADFTPHHLSGGSLFKRPHFEHFSSIIDRASQWLSDNPEINFLNAQSIDIKLKSRKKFIYFFHIYHS